MAWQTETELGYQEKLALTVEPLVSGEELADHPYGRCGIGDTSCEEVVAGVGCGFDPTRDAAIPLRLFIENATDGQPLALEARFTLGIAGSADDLTTTAYLEANYTAGPECSDPVSTYGPAEISLKFEDPTEPGGTVRSSYFVILKDYFSPRNPNGAVGELSSYVLKSAAQVSADDSLVSTTDASMFLSASND